MEQRLSFRQAGRVLVESRQPCERLGQLSLLDVGRLLVDLQSPLVFPFGQVGAVLCGVRVREIRQHFGDRQILGALALLADGQSRLIVPRASS